MSWRHLAAILWLRWRMSSNQLRRGGVVGTVFLALLGLAVVGASVGMFLVALLVGAVALPGASAETVMLVWDGVVAAFLFFWIAGLVTELQRSEVLSPQKLLHLPISLSWTFVVNYLGSLASLGLAIFLPGMVGLILALVIAKGPAMLLLFPLLAAFLLMVTAITYQFQGWLAALMVNKRRRRTVVAVVTVAFVLLFQLPNLLGNLFSELEGEAKALSAQHRETFSRLELEHQAGKISTDELARLRVAAEAEYDLKLASLYREQKARLYRRAALVNLALPIGWLPYGAMACARGSVLPAILGALGAALIGAASLWRSYQTTLRLYTGRLTSAAPRRTPPPAPATPARADAGFLERKLPGLSEHAAAVALVSFRSLVRAPEARIVLLTPVILTALFGSMVLTGRLNPPEMLRPFMVLGAVCVTLLTFQHLLGNQFGLDRDGFRALVLSPSSRRDILLGKNLATAPLALGLGVLLIALVQAVFPARVDHLVATLAELASTYLILCTVANFTSIFAPQPLATGSLRPAHPKAKAVLVQLLFIVLLPVCVGLAAFPVGLELVLHSLGRLRSLPIYLICSIPELLLVIWLYRRVLTFQGRLLEAHEQRVLVAVTTRVE